MDKYEEICQKTIDKKIPLNLDWELTYRCNIKCRHCYQTGEESRKELSKEQIFTVLDQLANMGCLFLTFSGGEIFLRNDLFDIIDYSKSKGFAFRLMTNGTLIDQEIARKVADSKPLAVEISLYAMDSQIHDWMTCCPGSYDKTLAAINMLRELDVNVKIKSTIVEENKNELKSLKAYADSIASPFTYYIGVVPQIDGNKKVCELSPCFDSAVQAFEDIQYNPSVMIEKRKQINYTPMCAAAQNSLYISPYGDVYPCVLLRYLCGNVLEKPIKDIWYGNKMEEVRAIQFSDLKDCQNCEILAYCDRCPGIAFLESGSLTGISQQDCFLAAARKKRHEQL